MLSDVISLMDQIITKMYASDTALSELIRARRAAAVLSVVISSLTMLFDHNAVQLIHPKILNDTTFIGRRQPRLNRDLMRLLACLPSGRYHR